MNNAAHPPGVRHGLAPLAIFKFAIILSMLLNAVQYPKAVYATDDAGNDPPCDIQSIINQLMNPIPEYQLHASALRQQLKSMLRNRQLGIGAEQSIGDDDFIEEDDKRSVASLAAQGLLKRSVATLAKNGQLPTPDPGDSESPQRNENKRYIGALARSGGYMGYGKRNVGTLARDFQLPQNGKRNLATLARLGLLQTNRDPKRNVAAVARYNSARMGAGSSSAPTAPEEKRNLGALKGSPVHGSQHKREDEELPPNVPAVEWDYVDMPDYWLYPNYADMDWGDYARAQKRFLDTSRDPELFGIENGGIMNMPEEYGRARYGMDSVGSGELVMPPQQKRHIGSVYRSGFLPSYRALRSSYSDYGGGVSGGGRFSRSGRARQFVESYPLRERLRQPIAAVCKRCFLPQRPAMHFASNAATRAGRYPVYWDVITANAPITINGNSIIDHNNAPEDIDDGDDEHSRSIQTNSLPFLRNPTMRDRRPSPRSSFNLRSHHWGTPPRLTALHGRYFRQTVNDPLEMNKY